MTTATDKFGAARRRKRSVHEGRSCPVVSAVDLFCGVGGLTHGLVRSGVQVVAGVDLDSSCRFPYETNNDARFVEADIRQLHGSQLRSLFRSETLKLLAGCAPCQPFSTYSRKGRQRRTDGKWDLVLDFGRLVRELSPDIVTMENVPQLRDHSVFDFFLQTLDGYHKWHEVVDCVDYGVPQTRKRLVLLASRLGPISLLPATHHHPRTVRNALAGMPRITAGSSDRRDPLHAACSLSDLNLKRIQASKPGGTWRDWPARLRAECHRKIGGETYPSVYGRMAWDSPAPTITTQCFGFGNGRFGHPEQDRAISLREAALIQTFPKHYKFVSDGDPVKFNVLGRLIGNAVPVRLGEIVGRSVLRHIQQIA